MGLSQFFHKFKNLPVSYYFKCVGKFNNLVNFEKIICVAVKGVLTPLTTVMSRTPTSPLAKPLLPPLTHITFIE